MTGFAAIRPPPSYGLSAAAVPASGVENGGVVEYPVAEAFEDMLTGGHPNSLGRTVEVVDQVLADPDRFEEVFGCYRSDDPVVRLRTSSAMKRLEARKPDLLIPHIDRFIKEVGALNQASAQWTLARLFGRLCGDMNERQRAAALKIMKRNLSDHDDWIVLNETIETLAAWAAKDPVLTKWLRPHLERLSSDGRKSVAS
ncbi:MAG: hypothetical protein AAF982_06655, partial [Pseudomonadota bacterium]